ncbi:MAG: MFS transporter [Deltaproteobacteria bacterium]|nr:MFS transporter [Deltaproteobacteria bacterium]
MAAQIKGPKIFFGWWTVLASGLLSLWGFGYYAYGISALFLPISTELGFSRALTSVAASIGRFEGGFEAPIAGWVADKFGPRWIVFIGIFVASISLCLMYYIHSLWSFYLVWGLLFGTGLNTALAVPLDTAISNWFVKKRGVALSIKWVFSGLSGVLILPLVAWLITVVGWRMACVIGGVVLGVVGLPMVWFWIKSHRPEYYGMLPDGAKMKEEDAHHEQDQDSMINKGVEYAAEVQEVEFTLRQAMKAPAYWLLILVMAVYGLVAPAINIHCIPFLMDRGISTVMAATMMAIMIGASIPSRYIGGVIADRLDIKQLRYAMAGAYFLQAVGLIIFLFHQTVAMIYVWFILYGIGMGAGITLNPSITARYFGRKAFGLIRGTSMFFLTPVGVAAPIYAGWVYDTTGQYISAFVLFAVLLVVSSAILPFVKPPKQPEVITDIRKIA